MSLRFPPPGLVLAMLAFGSATVAVASPAVPAAGPVAPEPKRPLALAVPAAAGPAASATAPTVPVAAASAAKPAAPASDAQRYCQNVAVAAADARFALQTRKLNELETQIGKRVADLEAREAEFKDVLARRDEATPSGPGPRWSASMPRCGPTPPPSSSRPSMTPPRRPC
jgi:hypothetical protein